MARIDDIAYAIMKQEGSVYLDTLQPKPGSVNHTMVTTRGLWNVGHINFANQNGAIAVKLTAGGREWAGWPTFQQAYQGLINQIKLDANRGDTIITFVKDYAPGADPGNVESDYVKGMVSYLGVPANTKLSDIIGGAPSSNPTPAPPGKPSLEGQASSPTSNSPLPPPTSGDESTNTSPVPPPSSVPPSAPPSRLSWWQRLLAWWFSS